MYTTQDLMDGCKNFDWQDVIRDLAYNNAIDMIRHIRQFAPIDGMTKFRCDHYINNAPTDKVVDGVLYLLFSEDEMVKYSKTSPKIGEDESRVLSVFDKLLRNVNKSNAAIEGNLNGKFIVAPVCSFLQVFNDTKGLKQRVFLVEIRVPHDIDRFKFIGTVIANGHNSGNGSVISYNGDLPKFGDFRDELLPEWISYIIGASRQNWCSDCNERRFRDCTYLLVDNDWKDKDDDWFQEQLELCANTKLMCEWRTEELAQVMPVLGSKCLEKFIPPGAFSIIKTLEYLRQTRKERKNVVQSYRDYNTKHLMYSVHEYLASLHAVTAKHGRYMPSRVKWTSSTPLSALNNLMYLRNPEISQPTEIMQEHLDYATKVIAYVKELERTGDKTSDRFLSMFQVFKHEDFSGLLYVNVAAAYEEYVAYSSRIERSSVRLDTQHSPGNNKAGGNVIRNNGAFYGNVGEKIDVDVVVLSRSNPFSSRFGGDSCVMVRLRTQCGCVLSYCSKLDEAPNVDDQLRVQGTIKAHDYFNMTRQTVLNRVKIEV